MGTHGATGTRARALTARRNTVSSNSVNSARRRLLNPFDWPVARRLFAVIVAALLMGLVFGGLRVYDSEGDASQFSRVSQLANLGEQLTVLVNDLQNERDATLLVLNSDNDASVVPLWAKTHQAVAAVQRAASIGGLPSNIAQDLQTVLADISPARISTLESALNPNLPPQDEGAVIGNYDADINDMIVLADQVSQGVSNASLTSDVEALNALSLAKEQASEERGLINYAIAGTDLSSVSLTQYFNPNLGAAGQQAQDFFVDPTTVSLFTTAYNQEFVDEAGFYASATPAETAFLSNAWGSSGRFVGVSLAENLSQNIMANNGSYTPTASSTTSSVSGSPLLFDAQGLGDPLTLSGAQALQQQTLEKDAPTPAESIQTLAQVLPAWEAGQADKLDGLQSTEQFIAGNIAATASQLQSASSRAADTSGLITLVVLLVVLLAALAVARSVVLPLRRLRAGALDIASVQLPDRVRLLTESPDAAASMTVAPINVADKDEIGEVARAFDQVHAEAVRLAGEQALLRSTFNAMFVNLSRRSAALIERLARMIDNLEQTEADPDRLGHLFSMDHLVTRMRRNSENLLLLAGHENPRKWSEPVPLADVVRAAISEIEQYNRITLNIAPGIAVAGGAVSDVAHLLAELIENATMFSAKDTPVQVVTQELSSGGVLIEISDRGIGVSEERLADMNWRLDNRPAIDVSVSRHMGLFAVARLAERHGVRVRLRPALPQGLSALVWLSDSVIERTSRYGYAGDWPSRSVGAGHGGQSSAGIRQIGGIPEAAAALARSGSSSGNDPSAAGPRVAKGWFRRRASDLSGAGGAGGAGGGTPQWRAPSSPSYDDQTTAGLPVRVPRNNLTPDPVTDNRTGGLPQRSDAARLGPVPGTGGGPGTGGQPPRRRSPDQVRSRMAGFQRGNLRAGTDQEQSPAAGEGSER
jgi:signal transduction histidine kinase